MASLEPDDDSSVSLFDIIVGFLAVGLATAVTVVVLRLLFPLG